KVQEVQKGWATLASGALPALSALPAAGSGEKYRSRRHPEQQIQRAVLEHLKLRHAPGVYWFHVANGGYRAPIEAKVLKSLGVMAGAPHLFLVPGGKTHRPDFKGQGGHPCPPPPPRPLPVPPPGAPGAGGPRADACAPPVARL